MKTKRKILATTALPYANGPLHLGHMVEHIQADIWMRLQKMQGHDCLFICGDDAHGTPIMISAEKQGISPEELIANTKRSHEADFNAFYIGFDNFYTTHSPENRELSTYIYKKLQERGDITTRTIQQAFDPVKNMFLPDRYVKGECPRCGAKDQYGDNCEVCGATYTPADLKNPVSAISGATPIWKDSVHYFFQLDNYKNMLSDWLATDVVSSAIRNKLNEWFEAGLEPWDISRDAPYFGFEIPDAPGKYFYVWLDAPVGYMASLKNLIARNPNINFDDYWAAKNNTELYHFIGKDIVYFHALFWPAMLEGSGFRKPTGIFTHGYLTINGLKMSKSRGTFITAQQYLQQLNPEYLRYYFAAKLGAGVDDIDLNLDDFMQRVNSDLIGKVINIASRCAGFITKYFDNKLADQLDEPELLDMALAKRDEIAKLYDSLHYNQAVREIMSVADIANQYIDKKKPWLMAKNSDELAEVQKVASTGLNLFRIIIGYLKPILPHIAQMSETFLNIDPLTWQNLTTPLTAHTINTYQPLITRIEKSQIESLINANKVNA